MRRWQLGGCAVLALLLVRSPLALALGSSSGNSVVNPPIDFHAVLTDRDGTKVECGRVNVAGEVQLEGTMGLGHLRIPFDNIEAVDFGPGSRDRSRATVHLKGGKSVDIEVRNTATFYGETPVGLYQIRTRDLKRVDFGK